MPVGRLYLLDTALFPSCSVWSHTARGWARRRQRGAGKVSVNGASGGPALGERAESSFGSGSASPVSYAVSTPRAAQLGVGTAVLGSGRWTARRAGRPPCASFLKRRWRAAHCVGVLGGGRRQGGRWAWKGQKDQNISNGGPFLVLYCPFLSLPCPFLVLCLSFNDGPLENPIFRFWV
jgi:hypothetical protein